MEATLKKKVLEDQCMPCYGAGFKQMTNITKSRKNKLWVRHVDINV